MVLAALLSQAFIKQTVQLLHDWNLSPEDVVNLNPKNPLVYVSDVPRQAAVKDLKMKRLKKLKTLKK